MISRGPQAREMMEDIGQLRPGTSFAGFVSSFLWLPPSLARSKRLPLGKSGLLTMEIALD